jgi:AbrB family looped-hinge helix DNA binding protein
MYEKYDLNDNHYIGILPSGSPGESMFPKHEFQGSTTVGERGQIVLPAETRKKHGIYAGDKLLVISHPLPTGARAITLIESSVLNELLTEMTEHIGQILDAHGKNEGKDTKE